MSSPVIKNAENLLRIDDPLAIAADNAPSSEISGRGGSLLKAIAQKLIFPDRTVFWALRLRGARAWARAVAPQIVLSTSPSLSTHFAGRMIAKATGAKWIAEFRDPVSWLPRENPTPGWKRWLLSRLERWIVNRADAVVVVSESFAEYFRSIYPGRPVFSIPNGAEFDEAKLLSAMAKRKESHKAYKTAPLVLVHAGELYNGERNPSPIIAAAKAAQVAISRPIKLRFIGRDSHLARKAAEALDAVQLVETVGALSHEETVRETERADGLVALLHDDPVARVSIMSKFFDYIATVNPILVVGDRQAMLSRIVEEEGVGKTCEYADVSGMTAWIMTLANTPGSCDYDAVAVCRKWSADAMAKSAANLFDSLVTSP